MSKENQSMRQIPIVYQDWGTLNRGALGYWVAAVKWFSWGKMADAVTYTIEECGCAHVGWRSVWRTSVLAAPFRAPVLGQRCWMMRCWSWGLGWTGRRRTQGAGSLQISAVVACSPSSHTMARSHLTASFYTQAIAPVRESQSCGQGTRPCDSPSQQSQPWHHCNPRLEQTISSVGKSRKVKVWPCLLKSTTHHCMPRRQLPQAMLLEERPVMPHAEALTARAMQVVQSLLWWVLTLIYSLFGKTL